jgi:hypothetical protein
MRYKHNINCVPLCVSLYASLARLLGHQVRFVVRIALRTFVIIHINEISYTKNRYDQLQPAFLRWLYEGTGYYLNSKTTGFLYSFEQEKPLVFIQFFNSILSVFGFGIKSCILRKKKNQKNLT